ncbi:integral membrane protein [gamma proteobacterium IMCC1989]|nr:integral membrane protein [gamma proteobacterium IMCC1989]
MLAVDLDGSLINTDLLHESVIKLVFTKPWLIAFLPFWLLSGKAYLKQQLDKAVTLDTEHLPWNLELIQYLETEKKAGRTIVLCTGSWQSLADKIASRFSFFTAAYGSSSEINLTGSDKANFLIEHYGEKNFSYVGNESLDVKIWQHAKSAVVVNASSTLIDKASAVCTVEKVISSDQSLSIRSILKQIRIHQWVKNALIFVPLITSHQLSDAGLFINATIAFIAYGLCASATYIINDLADLTSDRKSDKKKNRPLACGKITIPQGIIISAILLLSSLTVAAQLNVWFLFSLLTYIAVTLSYSFKLKRLQSLDITILASLFTLRIISGALAVEILPSFWLLAFSMFIFLCLALIKRLSEVINNQEKYSKETKLSGRGYYIGDFQVLMSLATASGMLSVLVFAMYINSPETILLYSEPYALWLLCPLFAYWIIRIIIMASRGEVDEDPILFAIKDSRSWVTGILILLIIFTSSV